MCLVYACFFLQNLVFKTFYIVSSSLNIFLPCFKPMHINMLWKFTLLYLLNQGSKHFQIFVDAMLLHLSSHYKFYNMLIIMICDDNFHITAFALMFFFFSFIFTKTKLESFFLWIFCILITSLLNYSPITKLKYIYNIHNLIYKITFKIYISIK